MSPQINNVGQIYVANGQLQVSNVGGEYLAVAAPTKVIDHFNVAIGSPQTKHYNVDVNALGLLIYNTNAPDNSTVTYTGDQSGVAFVVGNIPQKSGRVIPIIGGLDTTITVQFATNVSSGAEFYVCWTYELPDTGFLYFDQVPSIASPYNWGKASFIANGRVPIRVGDDTNTLSFASSSPSGTGSGVIVAAPGNGLCLVIWKVTFIEIGAAGGVRYIQMGTSSAGGLWQAAGTTPLNLIDNAGGLKLTVNQGITLSYNAIGASSCQIAYTTEVL